MGERHTEYILTDDEGVETRVVFVNRWCGCASLGCVDDEIRIYDDGPDDPPFTIEVSRYISGHLLGLFDGDFTIKRNPDVEEKTFK